MEDEKKVVFLLCVTDSVVPGRHVDLLLHECNGDQHYSTIKNFSQLISGQLNNHGHAIYCCKSACTLIQLKNYLQYMQ